MSLPPERIAVKRRRDEDPVEALYIHAKKQRPGAVWELQRRSDDQRQTTRNPLADNTGRGGENPAAPTNAATSNVFHRQTLKAGTRPTDRKQITAESESSFSWGDRYDGIANSAALKTSSPSVEDPVVGGGVATQNIPKLRRYHLSRDSFPSLKRQISFTGKVQKRQKTQRDRLAVFVESERGGELVDRIIRSHGQSNPVETINQQVQNKTIQVDEHGTSTVRKRPNVHAAERARRSDTSAHQNAFLSRSELERNKQPATNWDETSIRLARELQQYALEQSQSQKACSSTANLQFPSELHDHLPSTADVSNEVTKMTSTEHVELDEDGDFVVDTYIRAPLQPSNIEASTETSYDPLQTIGNFKIGIIIIDEEQEDIWEDFGDEQQSETDCESDEEDENAEDFYGNDYPDDEVDVDDEYGRNTYKYRTYDSADEEYGGDEPDWSDTEDKSYL